MTGHLHDALEKMRTTSLVQTHGLNQLTPEQTAALLADTAIPTWHQQQPKKRYCHSLRADVTPVCRLINARVSDCKLYPEGGYTSWHTASDMFGVRAIFTYATDYGGWFKYKRSNKITTLDDKLGWNVYVFTTTTDKPIWQCTYAKREKYSFNFCCRCTPSELAEYVLA
jgi:hypothetical protein